jgi:lipopolysaccharide biosynthesis glycosyltransferase
MTCKRTKFKDYVDESQKKKNRSESSVRIRVEHPFRIRKRVFGFDKVRYRGIAKNHHRLCGCLLLGNSYLPQTAGPARGVVCPRPENGLTGNQIKQQNRRLRRSIAQIRSTQHSTLLQAKKQPHAESFPRPEGDDLTLIPKSKGSCPFVFACDAGYAMQLATTLRSIAETNQWPLEVYVLSDGLSEDTKKKVVDSLPKGSALIRWLSVDLTAFAGFSTLRHISTATYARLLIASMLPDRVHRALYLDADILVLDDLAPIWELDLEGSVLGAVLDQRLSKHIKTSNASLTGLPHVRDYFNAGVILIDLARWRAERISEKALEYLKIYPHSLYSDQDALNVACDGLWKQLDPRWNYYQIDLKKPLSDLSAAQRPGIVHFHGCLKPWDARSLNPNAGFYDSFRTRTLFACTEVERLKHVPLVIWSRLKRVLKRSIVGSYVRNQLRSSQSPDGSNTDRRTFAPGSSRSRKWLLQHRAAETMRSGKKYRT